MSERVHYPVDAFGDPLCGREPGLMNWTLTGSPAHVTCLACRSRLHASGLLPRPAIRTMSGETGTERCGPGHPKSVDLDDCSGTAPRCHAPTPEAS